MDSIIPIISIVGLIFAFVVAQRHRDGTEEKRRARQATRAAKSSEKASKASERLSRESVAFSNAATEMFQKAQQAPSYFSWWYLCFFGRLSLWRSRWLMGRSLRLLDRAKAELQRCDAILDSLGLKHDV
ncbi:MAG: hypothetical protein ABSE90_04635 [Verrucomicrobiota bacterium]